MKLFSLLVLGAVASMTVATPALAATASCEIDSGSCTISNDGFDSISCGCQFEGEGGGGGSTGGDSWQGLSEQELLVLCFDHLESMCSIGNDTDGSYDDTGYGEVTTTTFGSVTTAYDPSDTDGDTDGNGDWGSDSATTGIGGEDTGWSPGGESGSGSPTTGNWGEDTGWIPSTTGSWGQDTGWNPGGESGSTDGGYDSFPGTTGVSSQGGEGQGDGPSWGDSAGEGADSTEEGGFGDDGDSEGSWGTSTSADPTGGSGGNPDLPWGSCSVTPSGRAGSGWMIGLLGLAGFLRRRRRS